MIKRERMKYQSIENRIQSGEIVNQKISRFLMELNSFSADRLDSTAMVCGDRNYSYRQMFHTWEYYAEVFSALHMTGKDGARVGILPGVSAEAIHALYALNLTGASVSMIPFFTAMNQDLLKKTIIAEGITDLIIADSFAMPLISRHIFPAVLERFLPLKKEANLSHLLVIRTTDDGPFASPCASLKRQCSLDQLRELPDFLLLEDLLEEYEASPVSYGTTESEEYALILHTSGTTKGISRPAPMSDAAVNAAVHRFLIYPEAKDFTGTAVTILPIEPATSYIMIDVVHLTFAFGGRIVLVPDGIYNPKMNQAFGFYRVNIIFGVKMMIDLWEKLPEKKKPDLSYLRLFAMGGSYLSPSRRRKINRFLKEQGSRVGVTNGYGLSEAGGACLLSPPDREDDSVGFPLPDVTVKIQDEKDGNYYGLENGPRTGGLFVSCPSLSKGRIGKDVYFELEEIDGLPYLATNDLVMVHEDGSLTCIGRTNQFFVDQEGSLFEAGLVEIAIGSKEGIRSCNVVPEFSKMTHDTVPSVYVTVDGPAKMAVSILRRALKEVFVKDSRFVSMSLPEMAVIAEEIPYNASGKVNAYEITRGNVKGDRYLIRPVRDGDKLLDLRLEPIKEIPMIDLEAILAQF